MSQTFQKPPTAQEAVLAELRRLIVTGRLRPGEQIVQDALAAELGVSRVPLRVGVPCGRLRRYSRRLGGKCNSDLRVRPQ